VPLADVAIAGARRSRVCWWSLRVVNAPVAAGRIAADLARFSRLWPLARGMCANGCSGP